MTGTRPARRTRRLLAAILTSATAVVSFAAPAHATADVAAPAHATADVATPAHATADVAAPAHTVAGVAERPASALPDRPTVTTVDSGDVGVQSSCWGTHSIWADSWTVNGSAGTVCDGTATFLRATVWIRQRDNFGFVSTCAGSWTYRDAYYTSNVVAPARCGASGMGYTYWIYSEHYAEINGQVFSFTGGHWD